MRRLAIIFLLVFSAQQSFAQQIQGPKPVEDQIIEPEEPPTAPLPLQVQEPTQHVVPFDRVMYVLDVSGSMRNKLADAIIVTDTFCSDGFKAAVVTFTDYYARWEGVPEEHSHAEDEACGPNCLEPGWIWLPAHRAELFSYLRSFIGAGSTDPTSALDYAYKNAPAGTLIVFISDGDFPLMLENGPRSAIRSAQAWRVEHDLAPVQMLVWATSEADSHRESLMELARLGGGGLWRADEHLTGPW